VIGETGGNLLRIAVAGRVALDLPVHEAERMWSNGMGRYFSRRVA
jgi:hypothetical protein